MIALNKHVWDYLQDNELICLLSDKVSVIDIEELKELETDSQLRFSVCEFKVRE